MDAPSPPDIWTVAEPFEFTAKETRVHNLTGTITLPKGDAASVHIVVGDADYFLRIWDGHEERPHTFSYRIPMQAGQTARVEFRPIIDDPTEPDGHF